MLSEAGYDLDTASNGREAVEKAKANVPDLILLDVVMPEMNGFEVCRALRADERTKNVPIILCTTRGESRNVEEGYKAGCSDYVTKPFLASELLSKIHEYLEPIKQAEASA